MSQIAQFYDPLGFASPLKNFWKAIITQVRKQGIKDTDVLPPQFQAKSFSWESQSHKIGTHKYTSHLSFNWKKQDTDLIEFSDSVQEASTIVIYSAIWFIEDQYIIQFLWHRFFELPIHHNTRRRINYRLTYCWILVNFKM